MEITKHPIEKKYNLLLLLLVTNVFITPNHSSRRKTWKFPFCQLSFHLFAVLVSMRRDNEGLTNPTNGLVTGLNPNFPYWYTFSPCLSRRDPSWLLTLKFQYQTLNDSPLNKSLFEQGEESNLRKLLSRVVPSITHLLPKYNFQITVGLSV